MLKHLIFCCTLIASPAFAEPCISSHPETTGRISGFGYKMWGLKMIRAAREVDVAFTNEIIKDEERLYTFGNAVSVECLSNTQRSLKEVVQVVIEESRG